MRAAEASAVRLPNGSPALPWESQRAHVPLLREVALVFTGRSHLARIPTYRTAAFLAQRGLCFYCRQPMAPASAQAAITRCTAEHLRPKVEMGRNQKDNLVAACWYCNHQRHAGRRNAQTPAEWATYVRYQVHCGRWPTAPTVAASISQEIGAELRAVENPLT